MNTQMMLLSFIVPVYNVEEYLEECLDSLVSQDIPCDEYEIICIDDGSTDKSGEILDDYAEKYQNIIVIHKENGGVSSARNCGIDIAKGEYIWFVDADDFIKANCLSLVKSKISEHDYDIIKILPYSFTHGDADFHPRNITPAMSQEYIKSFLWTKVLRKKHITENKIYFDKCIAYAEDAVFMLQLNVFLKSVSTIEESVLYFYRQRPGSAMSYNLNKKIQSRINGALVCDEIIQRKRVGDVEGAYGFKYISVVKIMGMAIKLPRFERNAVIKELKNKKIFPLKYNSKYTPNIRKSKATFVKKIRNILLDYSYTRIGLFALKVYCFFIDLGRKLK